MSSVDDKFPRRFGPYVLVQFLDEGGMGRVYLAFQGERGTESLCVVKLMGSAWSSFSKEQKPEFVERFKREAEISMALSHSSIAQTFHTDNSEHGPYLIQEFVHGQSLRSLASSVTDDTGAFPVPLAVYVVGQVAGALGYLHDFKSMGLVHRDVTPENIMLSFSGDVKLIDFGVAKATAMDTELSMVGSWAGKPYWTAPELSHGAKLDKRADLFSLGLMLWYLLSNQDPANTLEHPEGESERFHPPSKSNSKVPVELDRIVLKAINYDPALRYQTAEEFLKEISPFIPKGFDGRYEVADLLSRYSSPRKKEFLETLLADARPLLVQAVPAKFTQTFRLGKIGWYFLFVTFLGVGGYIAFLFLNSQRSELPVSLLPKPQLTVEPSVSPVVSAVSPSPVPIQLAPAPIPNEGGTDAKPVAELAPRSPRKVGARATPSQKLSKPQTKDEDILALAAESFERSELAEALHLAQIAAHKGGGAKAYIIIGSVLAIQRDIPGAIAAFENALVLSPENKVAQKHLDRLRR